MNRSISEFKGKQKIKLKEHLTDLKNNCIEQNIHLFNLFLLPNCEIIKAIDRFLLNPPYNLSKRHEQISIEIMKHIIEKAQEQKEKIKALK